MINEIESLETLDDSQFHISTDSLNSIIDSKGTEESNNGLNDDKDIETEFLTIVDKISESDEDSLDCSVPVKEVESIGKSGANSPKDDHCSDDDSTTEVASRISKGSEDTNNSQLSDNEERYYRVPDDDKADHSAEMELYLNSVYKTTAEYTELILDKTMYDTTIDIVDSTKICDTSDASGQKTD